MTSSADFWLKGISSMIFPEKVFFSDLIEKTSSIAPTGIKQKNRICIFLKVFTISNLIKFSQFDTYFKRKIFRDHFTDCRPVRRRRYGIVAGNSANEILYLAGVKEIVINRQMKKL